MNEIIIWHIILFLIATPLIWFVSQRKERTIYEKTKWNTKSHNKINNIEE